jgi:hypothetical protein
MWLLYKLMEAISTYHPQVNILCSLVTFCIILNYHLGGDAWTQTSAPLGSWSGIASDSTGQYLVAVQSYSGDIFISVTG